MEVVTILPIVMPPVVMAAGLEAARGQRAAVDDHALFNHPLTGLTPFYVVLAMPFTYRAIDTGVRAIDLHTLVDASRNLGASWPSTLARVILPNVETAVLGAMFLTVALCLGEVVIATTPAVRTPSRCRWSILSHQSQVGRLGRALDDHAWCSRSCCCSILSVPRRAQARLDSVRVI